MTLKNKIKKKYISGTVWNVFDRVIKLIYGFVVAAVLARYLGTSSFGSYNFIFSIVGLLEIISKFGMESIAIKNFTIINNKKNYTVALCLVAGIGVVISLISLCIVSKIYQDFSYSILLLSIIYILSTVFEVFRYIIFSCYDIKKYIIMKDVMVVIIIGLTILGVLQNYKVDYFIYLKLLGESVLFVLPIFFAIKYLYDDNDTYNIHNIGNYFLNSLIVCLPLVLSSLSVFVYTKVDQIMIGGMLTKKDLGIYSAVVKISESWYFLPSVLCTALLPMFTNLYKNQTTTFWDRYKLLIYDLESVAIIAAVIFTIFSRQIMTLIFGKEYISGSSSLVLYSWSGLFVCMGCVRSIYTTIIEYTRISFVASVCTAVVNILLNYILIPFMGIMGATIATVISQILQTYIFSFIYKDTRVIGRIQTFSLLGPLLLIKKIINKDVRMD